MATERDYYNRLLKRYKRYLRRLRRIESGDLTSIGPTKDRHWLIQALQKLYHQLLHLRHKIVLASSAGALFLVLNSGEVQAQACAKLLYTEQTGTSNPLNGEDIGYYATPYFVDLDNDGDLDMVAGELDGDFLYFENTGSASSPTFVERTGASNPLNGFDVGTYSTPAFVDIDNDGDLDMFAGETSANFNYFENTGTASSPTFVERTGGLNPLDGESVGTLWSAPFFVDIDNDGDFDMFSGEQYGTLVYYENTGSAASPTFVERTGGANPLDFVNVGNYSAPTFVDVDNDSDFDLIIGDNSGDLFYYENIGTTAAPNFVPRTGSANPLNNENVGYCSAPTLVDIDNDGDFDVFIGEQAGNFNFFELEETTVIATFDIVEEATNPLDGVDIGDRSAPVFIDIDNDGDLDMFSGERYGTLLYFENTGTVSAPVLVQRTGAANPMNGVDIGNRSTPELVDIDNDGDFDMFIGEGAGIFNFYRNTGSAASPTFTLVTGASNPLNGFDVGSRSTPDFVDIDNDGDFDLISGERYGTFLYYENTGTAGSATFVQRTGAANPLNGFDIDTGSAPAFADLDGDGDFDMYSGENDGVFNFFQNDGTAASPTFTLITGSTNPLNGEDVGMLSNPTFTDIDNDGDFDMFTGEEDGIFNFHENICPASILPIELVFFKAQVQGLKILLTWQTASEIDNDFFTIERSVNAREWEVVKIISADGDSFQLKDYTTEDPQPILGQSFYRLKQTDFDGSFSYSEFVTVNVVPPPGTIELFPNPVSSQLNYTITTNSSAQQNAKLMIYDMIGRKVLERKDPLSNGYNTFNVDIDALKKGTYIMKVLVNQGNLTTRRMIKK